MDLSARLQSSQDTVEDLVSELVEADKAKDAILSEALASCQEVETSQDKMIEELLKENRTLRNRCRLDNDNKVRMSAYQARHRPVIVEMDILQETPTCHGFPLHQDKSRSRDEAMARLTRCNQGQDCSKQIQPTSQLTLMTGQVTKKKVLRAKLKPPPPEPPGGEGFFEPLTREAKSSSSGSTSTLGFVVVPHNASCPSSHSEEPLISLKSEDSLRFEDLRRDISAMTTSIEVADASADWTLKKEEVDELLLAGVAASVAAPVSREDNPVNRDAPLIDLSQMKPESSDRLDHDLNAFKLSSLSIPSIESGEPVNNAQKEEIELDTVVPENFNTL